MSVTHTAETTTDQGTIVLGTTTYAVSTLTHSWIDHLRGDTEHTATHTFLTGPRGAQYQLRGFLGQDNGLRQVISCKSGQPLRVKGNEVRVYHIGDVIEVAK